MRATRVHVARGTLSTLSKQHYRRCFAVGCPSILKAPTNDQQGVARATFRSPSSTSSSAATQVTLALRALHPWRRRTNAERVRGDRLPGDLAELGTAQLRVSAAVQEHVLHVDVRSAELLVAADATTTRWVSAISDDDEC